jgi:pimeloyl-ACP methyl ester carboxylesterase
MQLPIPMPVLERHAPLSQTPYRHAMINGVRLPYVDEGRGAPVVCLHGAFADHRNWEPQREAIARGHRFVAYSQRYFGPEPWQDAGDLYSQETHVSDLAAFIRSLDAGPAYVIARSYGATVALLAGLRHPQLMRALLVQEPQIKSLVTDPAEQAILRDEGLGLAAVRATRLFFEWVNGQQGGFDLIPDDARRFHLANGRTIALHFAAPPGPRMSCAEMGALRVPLTVTRGEFTRPYMRICAEAVHRCVPAAELVVIPKARHAASAQNPAGFNEAILRFLATH